MVFDRNDTSIDHAARSASCRSIQLLSWPPQEKDIGVRLRQYAFECCRIGDRRVGVDDQKTVGRSG